MNLELVPSNGSSDLPDFLEYMYGGLEGYVAAATKRVNAEGEVDFKTEAFAWPVAKDVLLDWIIENSKVSEVYTSCAIFSEPRGKREFFKATNVVWTEFDGTIPTPEDLGAIPLPTLQVQSSAEGHQHWYWKLEAPLTDVDAVEGINRSLAYQLGADASAWDAVQILRPPSTYNHKRDLPVQLVVQSSDTVSPTHFDVLTPVEPQQVDVPEVIPDITDVVLKYAWPKEVGDLYRIKAPAPGQDRSAMLMRLGYDLAEMGLSDGEMFSVLRNADDRWGKFKDRTDRNRRLSDLIAKARSKYPIELVLDDDEVLIYGLQSFLATEVEIEWVIPGLLQEQGYMLLTGPAGVGKTQFSLRWAINLALGQDFLGQEIAEPRRILFFSLEMGHADLKFFLSTMCQGMSTEDLLTLEQNLLIAPLGEAFYLDQSKEQAKFEAILNQFEPNGVFIDSVGSSSSGQVTDESTVKALMDFNDKIRQRHGVFTWFIHHNRKAQGDNKKPNKMADVYGNQYLVNRATSVYCLWPGGGNNIEVIPLKKRLAAMEDPWAISRQGNLDFKKGGSVALKVPTNALLGLDEDEPIPASNLGDDL